MKDIKIIKNKTTIKPNKIAEPENIKVESFAVATVKKKNYSTVSTILFSFMSISMIAYVFMISSSVYYAVQANQYTYKGENISNSMLGDSVGQGDFAVNKSDRISYINKDSDTSISLK